MPAIQVPIQGGKVHLLPLQRLVGAEFEAIAVEQDGSGTKPQYQPLSAFDVSVRPGQLIYLRAKAAGEDSVGWTNAQPRRNAAHARRVC